MVGMHVDFGASGLDPGGEPRPLRRVDPLQADAAAQSVETAKASGTLKNGDTTKGMRAAVTLPSASSIVAMTTVRWRPFGSSSSLVKCGHLHAGARSNNYNGEHLMRGKNIEYTLRVKVIPYAP